MKEVRFICRTCRLNFIVAESSAEEFVKFHLGMGHDAFIDYN